MIRVAGVTQHYGVRPVLRKVDLDIAAGELVVIVGPNGMGKTTLLSAIAGVLEPQAGHVEIGGLRRRSSPDNELAILRQTVYLPDHPWLPKNRTGREFLLAVGRLYELEPTALMAHVDGLLELFDFHEQADWPIRSYSNGQKKKIAICSALVTRAAVYLLDEPFSGGLDPSGIFALKRVLRTLVERRKATVVMTSPVPELVEELADRIVVLVDGEIAAYDTPAGLRQQANCKGTLADTLERLIHPATLDNVERYLDEFSR